MVNRTADFFPARVNQRVPDLMYVADISNNAGQQRVDFGVVPTINTAVFTFPASTSAQVVTAGLPVQISGATAAKWGRCITIVGSTAAANSSLTILGRDYLGQRISETIVVTGVTPKTSVKVFAWVDAIQAGANANSTDTISIGTTDKLGLPFASVLLYASLMNGVSTTAHTFVARDNTNPATVATTDPRGTVALSTASNGARDFSVVVQLDARNLHGVAQFAG